MGLARGVLICLAALAGSLSAQAEGDAAEIADRYLAAMKRRGYAFLSADELTRRRDHVAAFVGRHLRGPLDAPTRAAVLEGVDRCIDRLYGIPGWKFEYGNGFGSGGVEWVYLNDRDYFLTFQYHLWVALTRPPLSPADAERRDEQRRWMRDYLTHGPCREPHPAGNEEARPRVLADLERSFADPLHLLSGPMSGEAFAKLKKRFQDFSNGIATDFHDMEEAAVASRFVAREDPAARYGRAYAGEVPFDDTVVDLWAGPQLFFASNADFRGSYGVIAQSDAYDLMRCVEMKADPALAPASPAMEAWLAVERRGELTLDGSTLVAVRGASIAELPVRTWFDADRLSDGQLRAAIRDAPRDRVPIGQLPRVNGLHKRDRSEGEFFVVVRSREDRLAVVLLHNYEFGQLSLWCRPRAPRP